MNKKESCETAKAGYKQSDQKELHAQAKVISALAKEQPQRLKDICKNAGISESTFYRMRRLLLNKGILKETEKGYALCSFNEVEGKIDDALREFKEKGYEVVGLDDLANKVGEEPNQIRELAYRAAHKYGLKIGMGSHRKERGYLSNMILK